jgi:hypothetical protein
MATLKKTVGLLAIILTSFIFYCSQEHTSALTAETSVSADVSWIRQGTSQNPTSVEYVRITITSLCDNHVQSQVFPFSSDSANAATVPTGCHFSLLFEGLDINYQTLYKGFVPDQIASGSAVSVSISAEECTPAPPESLKAVPSGRKILLTWTDRSNNEIGFIIKRAFGGDIHYQVLDTITECVYLDTLNIIRRLPYYYLVYSYNAIGTSNIADSIHGFSLSANTRPQFISINSDMDSTAEIGISYKDTIRFTDTDIGDSISLHIASAPSGFSLKDSIVSWTPDTSSSGNRYTIVAVIVDQDLSKDSLIWTVKVSTPVPQPPVFTVKELDLNAALFMGEAYTDTLIATDPNYESFTFSLISAPATALIDKDLGIVRWQADLPGEIGFTAKVTDITNMSDTVSWSVTVARK